MAYESVLDVVRAENPTLWLQLIEQRPSLRVDTFLKFLMSRDPFLKVMDHKGLDDMMNHHIDLLFHASRDSFLMECMVEQSGGGWDWRPGVTDQSKAALEDASAYNCAKLAMQVYDSLIHERIRDRDTRKTMPRTAPPSPAYELTRGCLMEVIVRRWSTTTDESEADDLIKYIGSAFLAADTKTESDLITKALRKESAECSVERKERGLMVLRKITNWSFAKDDLFTELATGTMKKLAQDSPITVARLAEIALIIGPHFSEAAEAVLMAKAKRIAKVDVAARSLIAQLQLNGTRRWSVEDIDESRLTGVIACMEGEDETRMHAILSVAIHVAQRWENPHKGVVTLKIRVRTADDESECSEIVVHRPHVAVEA